MKLILLFSILTFSTTYHIHAQAKYSLDKDTNRYINWPLYIVKIPGKQTIEPFYLLTDPSSLVSLKMSKDSTQKNIYGKKGYLWGYYHHLEKRNKTVTIGWIAELV